MIFFKINFITKLSKYFRITFCTVGKVLFLFSGWGNEKR